MEGKRALVRVVRTPEGRVVVDSTGKRSGRGAYVHAQRSCWETALKGSLAHALKVTLPEEDRRALEAFAETMAPDGPS